MQFKLNVVQGVQETLVRESENFVKVNRATKL